MATKNKDGKSSAAQKHSVHPEMQRKKPKAGPQGEESSKTDRPGTDTRRGHDKDGNARRN